MRHLYRTRSHRNPQKKQPMSPQEKRQYMALGERMLSESIHSLLYTHPFFADIVMGFNSYKPCFSTSTACVRMKNGKVDLVVNPEFFSLLTKEERTGVVLHEILHAAFRHLYREPKDFDHYVFNLAADIVCNDYVARWEGDKLVGTGPNVTLPPTCFTRMSFRDIHTPEDPSSFDIYRKLFAAKEQAKALGHLGPDPSRPQPDDSNRHGLDIPNYGQSAVDFFRRRLKKDKEKEKEKEKKENEQGEGNSEENEGLGPDQSAPEETDSYDDDQVGGHSDHSHWREDKEDGEETAEGEEGKEGEDGEPQTNRDKIEDTLGKSIISAARRALSQGRYDKIPGAFRGQLDELLGLGAESVTDWRSMLRRFLGSSSSTRLRTTRKRESHRFPGSEGTRIQRKKKVLVAIDTSGSMSVPIIARLMDEVGNIEKAGAEVHVIYFHDTLYNPLSPDGSKPYFVYRRGMAIPGVQRGGTDFEPIFQFAYGKDYDAVIVLTDGYASMPQTQIRSRVLWVLTDQANMDKPHLPWGPHLFMPTDDLAKQNPMRRNPFLRGRYK